jgi:hypothetical protein
MFLFLAILCIGACVREVNFLLKRSKVSPVFRHEFTEENGSRWVLVGVESFEKNGKK